MSVSHSRINSCTDFNEIWHGLDLIPEEEHRLLSITITDIYAGGAANKAGFL